MRALAILALALASCSNLIGINTFSTASDASALDAPASSIDAAAIADAPTNDAAVDAKLGTPDARLPDAHSVECGNNVVEPPEECDNGVVDTSGCNGDTAGAVSFGVECRFPACGDGYTNAAAGEVCDDRNGISCGTCNATCSGSITPTAASGRVAYIGANATTALDGVTITIADGINPTLTFEFDDNASVAIGNVAVAYAVGDAPSTVATKLSNTINGLGSTFLISATSSQKNVNLTHDRKTSLGNRTITTSDATLIGSIQGMSDCTTGTGCVMSDDCASGVCTANVCQ